MYLKERPHTKEKDEYFFMFLKLIFQEMQEKHFPKYKMKLLWGCVSTALCPPTLNYITHSYTVKTWNTVTGLWSMSTCSLEHVLVWPWPCDGLCEIAVYKNLTGLLVRNMANWKESSGGDRHRQTLAQCWVCPGCLVNISHCRSNCEIRPAPIGAGVTDPA